MGHADVSPIEPLAINAISQLCQNESRQEMKMLSFGYRKLSLGAFAVGVSLLLFLAAPLSAQYQVVSLVANEKDLGNQIPQATHMDPHIANAWGLANLPDGPFWVTDELTGFATVYGPDGTSRPLVVTVPPSPNDPLPPGCPTGIVANPYGGFTISENGKSGSALFIFVTLDGTISGWNPKVDRGNAVIAVNNSSEPAAYTGLDITHDSSGTFIYVVNAALNRIEKYNSNFDLVTTFSDSSIPYGVYGVSALKGKIYVAYAPEFPGKAGAGAVDVFDTSGNLIKTLIAAQQPGGPLNIPYGMAIAPANFGKFSNALLVGNLQDGRINAFDLNSGTFLGPLADKSGNPIEVPGIWDFDFGGGHSNNGQTNELFFVAGPDTYYGGLFGEITVEK
jgi:uncharacterized protein (TIGR03118 family)